MAEGGELVGAWAAARAESRAGERRQCWRVEIISMQRVRFPPALFFPQPVLEPAAPVPCPFFVAPFHSE